LASTETGSARKLAASRNLEEDRMNPDDRPDNGHQQAASPAADTRAAGTRAAAGLASTRLAAPWTKRAGQFWNASFGAAQSLGEQPAPAAIAEFFQAGRSAAG
jgi:hypothetical protein